MEILILSEPEAAPFPGFRYRIIIGDFLELKSTAVFDDWTDALAEAVREWVEEWEG